MNDDTEELDDEIVLSGSIADQHKHFFELSKKEGIPVSDQIAAGKFALQIEKFIKDRGPVAGAVNADYFGEDLSGISRTLREILRLDKKKSRLRKRS